GCGADWGGGGARGGRPRRPRQFWRPWARDQPPTLRAEPPVGVDHGLAVGAGLGEPLRGEALADLLQARLQCVARRQYFQPVGGELLAGPLVLILLHPPAARFSGGGDLEHLILRRLVDA